MEPKRPLAVKLAAAYLALYAVLRLVELVRAIGETVTAYMYGNRLALALPLVRIVVAAVTVVVLMEGKRYGHAFGLLVLALAFADRAWAGVVHLPVGIPGNPSGGAALGMPWGELTWDLVLAGFWFWFAFSSATRAFFRPRAAPTSETQPRLASIFE